MDRYLVARFPFLDEAKAMADENRVDIEMLISSDEFSESRRRGVERLLQTIEKSDIDSVSTISDYECLIEVMSYPYARIIVSCINDRFLTKRYALSESVKMKKALGGEDKSTVLAIARSLNVNSTLEDDKLKMHFSDFLRFSTRIKSPEWKLVNQEVYGGYVFLPHEKFDRVLQNALQDRIESELPLAVPDEFRKTIERDIKEVAAVLSDAKSRFEPKFTGELKDDILPPCIAALLSSATHGVNLPHSGRFALVSFLHAIGMDSQQILGIFSQSPDFDESKSIYQIKHITGELNGTEGYTAPECHYMKSNGLCSNADNLCNSEKMNHPLIYYRIKTKAPRPQEQQENHS